MVRSQACELFSVLKRICEMLSAVRVLSSEVLLVLTKLTSCPLPAAITPMTMTVIKTSGSE
jgi:hypothetical protein